MTRIAVIDDNKDVRKCLGIFLKLLGFKVREFDSAEKFLIALNRSLKMDLLITDFHLKEMSGWELVKKLQIDFKDTFPIVLISTDLAAANLAENLEIHFMDKFRINEDLPTLLQNIFFKGQGEQALNAGWGATEANCAHNFK